MISYEQAAKKAYETLDFTTSSEEHDAYIFTDEREKWDGEIVFLKEDGRELSMLEYVMGDYLVNTIPFVKAAIYGVAVGDALGVPVEFTARFERKEDPVTGMREYGTHSQPKGAWSDDSSMMFAEMDSVIQCGEYSAADVMDKYSKWLLKGEYTPHGRVFDVGITCSGAINRFRAGTAPEMCGGSGERDNGNGSLMRIMPSALREAFLPDFWDHETLDSVIGRIHLSSSLTHRHPRSLIGCMIYTAICHEIIYRRNRTFKEVVGDAATRILAYYDAASPELPWNDAEMVNEVKKDSYKRLRDLEPFAELPEGEIESSGYIVHTLEAAIWCMLNSESYAESVLKAVNLGDDTDTVGAVTGGLAGLWYGYEGIPEEWIDVLASREWIEGLCEDFAKVV